MADKILIELILEPKAEKGAFKDVDNKSKAAGKKAGDKFGTAFGGSLKDTFKKIGKNVAGLTAAFLVARKAFSVFKGATNEAADFEQGLVEINTILPKTAKIAGSTTFQLRQFAKTFGTSATQQAKGFYQVVSAGITDTSKSLKLLTSANTLAVGGLGSVESSINVLTDIINVFGGDATDAVDSLFQTVKLGKTTIPELSSSLGQMLSPAKNLGIELDTVNAALATLTVRGNSTSENVTQLTSLFSAIAKNSVKLGKGLDVAAVKSDGFVKVMERLQTKTNGSQTALFKLLGRKEAVNAFLKLSSDGFAKLGDNIGKFESKSGAAADAFKLVERSSAFQFKQFDAGIADLEISLGQILLPTLNKLVRGFITLSDSMTTAFRKDSEKTEVELIDRALGNLQGRIVSLKDTIGRAGEKGFLGNFFDLDDFVKSGKAEKRLAGLGVELKKLQDDRLKLTKETEKLEAKEAQDNAAKSAAIQAQETALARFKSGLGLTQSQKLQENLAADFAAIEAAKEAKLISTDEENARKLVVQGEFNNQMATLNDQRLAREEVSFSSLSEAFAANNRKMKGGALELAKALQGSFARGFGSAFSAVGAAMAKGENAFAAFSDGMKKMFGGMASAAGDFYIKLGIASMAAQNYAVGAAELAAGAGLKVLGGVLGASSGSSGSSGSTAASSASAQGFESTDQGFQDSGVTEEQTEFQDQRNIQVVVQNSYNDEETGKAVIEAINSAFDNTGAAFTNTRLV